MLNDPINTRKVSINDTEIWSKPLYILSQDPITECIKHKNAVGISKIIEVAQSLLNTVEGIKNGILIEKAAIAENKEILKIVIYEKTGSNC